MDAQAMARVIEAGDRMADHLADIAKLFVPGMKLTLLARHPGFPDGSRDIVMGDDQDLEAIVAAVRAAMTKGEKVR